MLETESSKEQDCSPVALIPISFNNSRSKSCVYLFCTLVYSTTCISLWWHFARNETYLQGFLGILIKGHGLKFEINVSSSFNIGYRTHTLVIML